jgi:hypothetical protein
LIECFTAGNPTALSGIAIIGPGEAARAGTGGDPAAAKG